jgi:cyclopropane-fatty-acyl-phospholipid synthase
VQNYGCSLTTTTISQEQLSKASERVEAAGISDRVRLLDADYRDLTGQFDKLVSIEMIEAVGADFLDDYFQQCGRLLKPGGRFILQGIVMPEQRYESYRRSVDFIQKYIFPGGFLPSVAAIQDSVGRNSTLRLESVEDLSAHWASTTDSYACGNTTFVTAKRRFASRLSVSCKWSGISRIIRADAHTGGDLRGR